MPEPVTVLVVVIALFFCVVGAVVIAIFAGVWVLDRRHARACDPEKCAHQFIEQVAAFPELCRCTQCRTLLAGAR